MAKPILEPYLYFNGNCREAMTFYQHVFDAEAPYIMTYADAQMDGAEVDVSKVMHASIRLGEVNLMASDDPAGEVRAGNAIYLNYATYDNAEAQRIWDRMVEAGAEIEMPLKPEFFAELFGSLKDPYGITWQIMGMVKE